MKIDLALLSNYEIGKLINEATPGVFNVIVEAVDNRLRHERLVEKWKAEAASLPPLNDEEIALVRDHKVISAIKAYRERTMVTHADGRVKLAGIGTCKWMTEQVAS